MSKLREIEKNANQQALGNGLQSNQSVSPVADVQMFDTVMSSQQSSTDEDSKKKNEDDKSVSGVQKKNAKETDSASEQKDTGETTATDTEKDLNAQNQTEIDAMEQYKLNLSQLAQQLNVMLDHQQQVQPQQNPGLQVQTALKGALPVDNIQSAAQQIDPQLLRKVDVKTLKQQLDLAVNPDDSIDLPPPQEVAQVDLDPKQSLLTPEKTDLPADSLASKKSDLKLENFLKADDFDLSQFMNTQPVSHVIEDLQPVTNEIIQKPVDSLTRILPVVTDEKPAVVMNVVSIDLNRMSRMEAHLDEKSQFISDLLKTPTSSLPSSDSTSSSWSTPPSSAQSTTTSSTMLPQGMPASFVPLAANNPAQSTFTSAFLQPIRTQVEGIVMEMSGDAKTGITRLQIHPPNLGSIDIKFTVKGNNVKAEIITQNETTKELLQGHMQQLKDIMIAQNLTVDDFKLKTDADHFKETQKNIVAEFNQSQNPYPDAQFSSRGHSQENLARQEQMEKLRLLMLNQRALTNSAIDVTI